MSVGIATMGMFNPPGQLTGGDLDRSSDPIAFGGGMIPGTYPYMEKKRLKVSVRQVNSFNEKVKIKVVIDD